MLYHISCHDGVLNSVERLFHEIQHRYDSSHRIVYFNNNTSGTLARALRDSTATWVRDLQRTTKFEYERVLSVFELVQKIQASECQLVVVEQLDAIMQENTTHDYAEQNAVLAELMAMQRDMVFLDTWLYLDTYFYRQKFEQTLDPVT